MAETFVLSGDPSSIRASAAVWAAFATDASTASSDVRSLDTSEFQGDEADSYRTKVSDDLPPRLDTTSQAWQLVSTALRGYANTLEDLQTRMAALKAKAGDQAATVDNAQDALTSARSADKAHAESRQDAAEKLKPGETLPADTYHGQAGGAQSSLSSAKQALQDTIDAAATVRAEHTRALDACCGDIDRAKGMRFADPPGFWGKLAESVGDWIKDHADVLTQLSSVLKTISGIAGLLALIPCLTPIMGPIALITGGAALAIDVGLKLATGQGSWLQIGVDALSMIPGARAAKLAFGASVAVTGYNITQGNATWADMAMVVGMQAFGNRIAIRNRAAFEARALNAGVVKYEPAMMMSGEGVALHAGGGGGGVGFDKGAWAAERAKPVKVTIDGTKYYESATHIDEATTLGLQYRGSDPSGKTIHQPTELTVDRGGAKARRRASTSQVERKLFGGMDRDEYPPAMFAEGGRDASVKYVSRSDNRGAGSSMGNQLRGLPNGTKVNIVTTFVPSS
jgi:hypothetical protein